MDSAPFRIAFGISWVLVSGIRLSFQMRGRGVARVARRHERRERFFYNLVAATYLLMLLYVLTPWLDAAHLPLPAWLRWLGCGIAGAGIWLFLWSHQMLGNNWSGILELSTDHVMVTEGPYRYVRHPMYSAFFVSGFGLFLLSANWLIGVSHLGSLAWMYLVRVSAEEEMMMDRFGDAYDRHMKTTGRLLPRLRERH
jgi:protein-S-isoprenylcysteine O-methyltransferase Ste14